MSITQKRLVLDRTHLIAMVGDPELYRACPALVWVRDTALLAGRAYNESKKRRCCGGDWKIMRPAVDGLFAALKQLHSEDPASLEQVRDYLERKKGYRPVPVVLYYRAAKQGKPAKFQF